MTTRAVYNDANGNADDTSNGHITHCSEWWQLLQFMLMLMAVQMILATVTLSTALNDDNSCSLYWC